MSNANELAFPEVKTEPRHDRHRGEYSDTYSTGGLTKREHAAILLRVPKSGDDEIDAMIREANRRDAAAAAMRGLLSRESAKPMGFQIADINDFHQRMAEIAIHSADAILAELERTA